MIKSIEKVLEKYKNDSVLAAALTPQDVDVLVKIRNNMVMLYQKWRAIFVWQDGPLVEAMKAGNIVLVDEISLADDSVLERLNSVLETGRKLVSIFFVREKRGGWEVHCYSYTSSLLVVHKFVIKEPCIHFHHRAIP